jgi:radical SAM superfamily enzyme with C-terminal helix-hairpin-helix motif
MRVLSFLGALGAGIFVAAWLASLQQRGRLVRGGFPAPLNINEASRDEIMASLGLDAETAERIVEHRPYPSKLDLLGRMVVPEEVYLAIKDRIAYKAG